MSQTVLFIHGGWVPACWGPFPDRAHRLIAQDGCEEVAQACIDWIGSIRAIGPPRRVDEGAPAVTRVSEVQIPSTAAHDAAERR